MARMYRINRDVRAGSSRDPSPVSMLFVRSICNFERQKINLDQLVAADAITEDVIAESPNKYGAVETLNFERKQINLKQLNDAGAIKVVTNMTLVQPAGH